MTLIINKIWSAVCSGDIDTLEKLSIHWKGKKVILLGFGIKHSLIMGALRNKEYETVRYLIKNGEQLLSHEVKEFYNEKKSI